MILRNRAIYYLKYYIPTTTCTLYILVEICGFGWFVSYLVASFITATIMYPLDSILFKRVGEEKK